MKKVHPPLTQALGKSGPDIVLSQVLQQGVLGQDGEGGKGANHIAEDGKEHVMELGHDFLAEIQEFPIGGSEAAQGKEIPKASSSQKHQ